MTATKGTTGLNYADVSMGDGITPVSLPITYRRVCINATSTWDWFPERYDPEYARSQGQENIYLSTLFYHGFVDRGLGDWDGPDALIRWRKISMVKSIYPGQTATLTGKVVSKREENSARLADLELLVASEEGPRVPSEATVELPA